jgi:hypothetical protein
MLAQLRIAFICPCCGSKDVSWDTTCYWDTTAQKFRLSDDYPTAHGAACCDCGFEGEATKFPLESP